MKKILKGSVIISEQEEKFWVIDHIKGFIKTLNERGFEQNISESVAERGTVIAGSDAMEIIKSVWYK